MRELFTIDTKDYNIKGTVSSRPSSRAIIIKENKIAMVHSVKYNYYKFPGGGIDKNESKIDALVREAKEEAGLTIILDSIKEYGHVYRIQKGDYEDVFIQDNYYYLCDAMEEKVLQKLDDYELDAQFKLVYTDPNVAIKANLEIKDTKRDPIELNREAKVLQMLIDEGYFTK